MGARMSERKWVVKVNGRKSLNGARYGVTLDGVLTVTKPDTTIYDAAAVVCMAMKRHNREMEFPESIQVSLP
jgi:hypothetical protein